MIGSQVDADLARARWIEQDYTDILSLDGGQRAVYLINGVVYKVNLGDDLFYNDNLMEFERYSAFVAKGIKGVNFPATALFESGNDHVIAMQYIKGQPVAECFCLDCEECDDYCMSDDILALLSPIGIDVSGFNVIINDNGPWIIDFG